MKILVLCDEGNNRSVTIAHQLKYWGHDVIAAGVKRNTPETIALLTDWADRVIITELGQLEGAKVQAWETGPDVFPRPFNRELLSIVKALMEKHRDEYKNN